MQTVNANQEYKEGVFVQELKNRFLCEVLIDGALTVCYVPSSCHLGNFLSLAGKRVFSFPPRIKKHGLRIRYLQSPTSTAMYY